MSKKHYNLRICKVSEILIEGSVTYMIYNNSDHSHLRSVKILKNML